MFWPKTFILLQLQILVVNISAFSVTRQPSVRSNQINPSSRFIQTSFQGGNERINGVSPAEVVRHAYQTTTSPRTEQSGTHSANLDPKATTLKEELMSLLRERSDRGFQATSAERDQIKDLIFQLAPLNSSKEPASPYYDGNSKTASSSARDDIYTLSGKWTLIYTDAPDIIALDTSQNPLSTVQLGRVGQECCPPYIKNVIEWKRPEWARNLPFSGGEESSVLQKVVTSASASPSQPRIVNLKVTGLELEAWSTGGPYSSAGKAKDMISRIEKDGLLAGILSANPVDLKGPLNLPFGRFEVLYLDEDLRITKTNQNRLAVNRRLQEGDEWF